MDIFVLAMITKRILNKKKINQPYFKRMQPCYTSLEDIFSSCCAELLPLLYHHFLGDFGSHVKMLLEREFLSFCFTSSNSGIRLRKQLMLPAHGMKTLVLIPGIGSLTNPELKTSVSKIVRERSAIGGSQWQVDDWCLQSIIHKRNCIRAKRWPRRSPVFE